MRRRTVTILIAALCASTVATPIPASTEPNTRAERATTTSYQVHMRPVAVQGWRWRIWVGRWGPEVSLSVTASKMAKTGNRPAQSYSWDFSLPRSALTADRDLLPTRIDTGDSLGAYGRIRARLTDASSLSREVDRCRKTGEILQRSWTRTGTMSGTIVFRPNLAGLPQRLSFSPLATRVTRISFTGNDCPAGGGSRCFTGRQLFAAGDVNLWASARGKEADVGLDRDENPAPGPRTYHAIFGFVPSSAFQMTTTTATIHGSALAPFASGSITFSLTKVGSRGTSCVTTEYEGTYDSGSIIARFVDGDVEVKDFDSISVIRIREV